MKLNFRRFVAILLVAMMTLTALPTAGIAEITGASRGVSLRSVVQPGEGDVYVTYNFVVGESVHDTQIVKNGGTVTEPATPEVPEGKRFEGWYEGNTPFTFGTVSATENKTVTVEARFTDVYYVYFMTVDSNVFATAEAVAPNYTVALPDNYEPEGQRVTGWKTENGAFTANTKVTADTTVVPEVVDCYWVTFDSQGGKVLPSRYVDKGDTLNLSDIRRPTRTGYTFKGWSETANGNVITSVTPNSDVILYAVWTPAQVNYTVVYWGENANDTDYGTFLGSVTRKGYTGRTVTASNSIPSSIKNGKYFKFVESDKQEVKADGSTVVTVRCSRNEYTLTFDLGDNSNHKLTMGGKTYTGGSYVTRYSIRAKYEADIESQWPTVANFETSSGFAGWQASNNIWVSKRINMTAELCSEGTVYAAYDAMYTHELNYMFESFDQTSGENGKERKRYGGVYYDRSAEYTQTVMANTYSQFRAKVISGMTKKAVTSDWNDDDVRVTFLYYTRNEYTLTLNNYGATTTTKLKYGAPINNPGTPRRPAGFSENAVFKGWYTVDVGNIGDSTKPYDFTGKTMPAENMTLFAYWEEAKVNLTVEYGNGYTDEKKIGTKIFEFGSYTDAVTRINADGKRVLKWVDKETGETYTVNQPIAKNTTIKPIFAGDIYQVTYVLNGGDNTTVQDGRKYGYESKAKVLPGNNAGAPEGKAFAYWQDEAGNVYRPGQYLTMTANVTLTAVYTDIHGKVSLTYHSNFDPDQTYTTDEMPDNGEVIVAEYSETQLPDRAGYNFLGWNTDSQAKTVEFAPRMAVRLEGDGNDLYAIWEARTDTKYTVEFYHQNTDGTYPTKANASVERQGTTDAVVQVAPGDKNPRENNKYVWDNAANNIESGTVSAVEPLVLKLYFKLNTAQYTIHHYLKDTEIPVAPDQTDTMQIGTTLTAAAAPEKDLIIKDVKAEEPFGSITIGADPAQNVITVYYTKDVTFEGESGTRTYNGNVQELTGITVRGLLDGDTYTGLSYSAKGTDVGEYTGEFTGAPTFTDASGKEVSYYNVIGKVRGKLTITPITTAITITAASDSKTYDGTPLTNAGYTYTPDVLLEGDVLTAVVEGSATNVGDEGKNVVKSYKVMRGNVDVTGNYTFTGSLDGKLTVTPVEIELTAASDSKTYDGTPLTNGNYTITVGSFVGEEGLAGVTVEGSQTTVGSSANTITGHALKENTKAQNYDITYKPGTLEVTQNTETIIITANSNTWEYDGQPHTDGGYTVNYEGKDYIVAAGESVVLPTGDKLTATVEGTVTNVADSADNNNNVTDVTIVNGNGNSVRDQYATITRIPGGLKITRRGAGEKKVLLTAADNTVDYDGQAHGAKLNAEGNIEVNTSYTITYLAEGHSVQTVTITGSQTNVGKYPRELVPSGAIIVDGDGKDVTANYLVAYKEGDLEITSPDPVIVEIRGHQKTFTYNANPHGVYGYTVLSISNSAYTAEDFGMVEGASAYAEGTNVGKYDMNLTAESFENRNANFNSVVFKVEDGWLEITPVTEEVTVNITGNTDSKVYDGKEHAVTGYTTDVGEKTITVALKEGKTAEAKGTKAGMYYMGLTKDDFTVTSANYSNIKVVVEDGYLEITPVTDKVTVTIEGHKDTFKYDGMEHTVTGYDVTDISNPLYTEADFTFSGIAEVKGKNASELPYLMGLNASQFTNVSGNFSNVEFVVTDGQLTINPRNITIRANNVTVEYDGKPHGENGYTLGGDGLAEGETILGLVIDGEQTEAGFYPGELRPRDALIGAEGEEIYPDNYNYKIEYANGNLEIAPVAAEVVVTITEHGGKAKYDGTEHVVTGYDVTSISNSLYTDADFDFKGKAEVKGIDAGSYPMLLKSADFVNTSKNFAKVTFVIVDATLEIEKREVTLTSASDEKVYDGKALTNDEVTASGDGFAEDEGAYCGVTGRQLNVGESDNEFTYELLRGTKAGNYKITKEYGTLKVTPVTEEVVVTITGHKGSAKYDGSEKTVTGYDVTGISNPLYTENDFTFSGDATASGIHAGKYPMGLKAEDFKNTSENFANVKFVVEDGEMEIQKIALTITSESYEGDYDAQWHQVGYTAEGLAATDAITALEMKNHRILKPGEMVSEFVANTLKITHADGSDATGDYEVTFVPGKLTVNTVIVNYRVFYYYDGVLDESEIEEGTGEVLTQITEYKDKPKDMQFDHVTGFPLTLGLDEMKNIIRVYYVHTPLTGNLGAANIGDCIE